MRTYQVKQLPPGDPNGATWAVYESWGKAIGENYLTAIALCYTEDAARRICDLVNATQDYKLLAVIDNWRIGLLDSDDKEKITDIVIEAIERKVSNNKKVPR